jgi:hypothetical protein
MRMHACLDAGVASLLHDRLPGGLLVSSVVGLLGFCVAKWNSTAAR